MATSDAREVTVFDGPSPFHVGEQKVQSMAGSRDLSEQLGRAWHRHQLSPASKRFFGEQQLLYTATRSKDDRLWATVLAGPQGFVSSPDAMALTVQPFKQFKGDPAVFEGDDHIGLTGIVLETRQRERLNGRIKAVSDGSLTVSVEQSFGSCPKYIQARRVEICDVELHSVGKRGDVSQGAEELGSPQRQMIERADTMFLATCYLEDLEGADGKQGADISHRGGPPGFVQVSGPGTVRFADYVGNYTFTTLGNLVVDPRASLLFVDYSNGDTLQLSGKCQILWEDKTLPGAQRTMEFVTERWVHVRGALPLRAPGDVRWSPYNPLPTCEYSAYIGKDRLQQLHNNYVKKDCPYVYIRCLTAERESEDVKTFEFENAKFDGQYKRKRTSGNVVCDPGQFATFDFPDIKTGETLNRTWTISSPQSRIRARNAFTITVKKVGVASAWMFANMKPGRTICLRGIDGDFTLDQAQPRPSAGFLFIAGGIGITPLQAMFHQCVEEGVPVTLLYSVRKQEDAVFWEDLAKVSSLSPKASAFLTLTGGSRGDNIGSRDSVLRGHITAAMLEKVCGDLRDRHIFQCGPPAMMSSVATQLASLDFPLGRLHQEAFFF